MVLGIIAVVLWFFGYSAIISVVLGIIGLIGGAVFLHSLRRLRGNAGRGGRIRLSLAGDPAARGLPSLASCFPIFIFSATPCLHTA